MLVSVRQQREKTRALDGDCQLSLVEGLRAGDPARNDLACLGDVALECRQILVVNLLDALGRKATELLAARETSAAAAATTATAATAAATTATAAPTTTRST